MARGIDKKTEWDENARDFMRAIGHNLRERRKSLQKSLITLAADVGLTKSTVSRIERGESDFPISHLYNFAVALNTCPADLLPETLGMVKDNKHVNNYILTEPAPGGG